MQNNRLPGLDLVRVLSVLFIILSHAGYETFRGIGVPFLLALSGFLITKTLLKSQLNGCGINITHFWKNRFLRIAPAYFVFVAAVFALDTIILGDEWRHGLVFFLFTHTVNYYNSIFGHEEASGVVAHLWTLSMMEQFYFLYPIFLTAAFKSKHPVKVIFLAIILSILWRVYIYTENTNIEHIKSWIYNALDTRLDSLLIGCLMAFILEKMPYNKVNIKPIFSLSILFLSFCFFRLVYITPAIHYTIGFSLEAILATLMIFSIMKLSEIKFLSIVNSRIVRKIALITYPMYLYHPIGLALGRKISHVEAIALFVGILCTGLIGMCSYLIIEKRFAKSNSGMRGVFSKT